MNRTIRRRDFLKAAGACGAGFWVAAPERGFGQERSANAKLNLAVIGVGGRGGENLKSVSSQNIVALCDVNEKNLERAAAKFPGAKRYVDFRTMWDDEKTFDAAVISTCEHTHAFATLPALKLGKHVYCEKPLTHGVWEARRVAETALKMKVATQMGTQIHATENYRRVVELVQSGALGKVTEAHVWVGRAWGWQSPEDAKANGDFLTQERPKDEDEVPEGLHWDLWLGPAPARPFNKIYFPGPRWYRWWEWGSGTMSDLGSHWNDLPFWALKLRHPLTVEGFGPPVQPDLAPASFRATYEYGPRGELPACTMHWYQGREKPVLWTEKKIPSWPSGCLFVGDEGMLLADYGKHVLLPEAKFKDFRKPAPSIPPSQGHHAEWIEAAKAHTPTTCNFDYSGALTEANHLASIAYRLGKKLEWDPVHLRAKNAPEADPLIRREYRKGWDLTA